MLSKPSPTAFRTSETPLPSASDLRKRCPHAVEVVERLRGAGFTALFAGGCVRDLLLGREFKDIDIASDAPPEAVEALFDRTHAIGKAFGVVQVVLEDEVFEVAAFRHDLAYHDGRRPEGYEPTTPEEDAKRRDFTVNGLFLDPVSIKILDFVGGREDLAARRVRAIGHPAERFREDHLRLLRAARFAAVLEFDIEPATLDAVRQHAHLLPKVSVERIRGEFVRILTEAPRAGDAVELLHDCGLLAHILPEFLDLKGCAQPPEYHPEGDVWTHTVMMLNELDHPSPALALATLLHDIGKPPTQTVEDRIRFKGHARAGAEMAEDWMSRMKFGKALRKEVCGMVDRHMNFINIKRMRRATLRKLVARPCFEDELELHRVDCLCSNGITESAEIARLARKEFEAEEALPDPLVTGRDLIDLGLEPGPEIGKWKHLAYDRQLEMENPDRDRLLDWLRAETGSS